MKKILLILSLLIGTSSFAASKVKTDQKFTALIESVFTQPIVITDPRLSQGKHFNYKSFKNLSNKTEKKSLISNYLKLQDINVIEGEKETLVVKSRNSIKMGIPVYNETFPSDLREQMITVVMSIPKHLQKQGVARDLRSHYSKDGDIKVTANKKKIIISDWVSNQKKILSIIKNL
ncbi:MAG: hypothetical protein ACRBBP_00135 [Bdellovibrionales bacterium]